MRHFLKGIYACLVGALLSVNYVHIAVATEQVVGAGVIRYQGAEPDAASRAGALYQAKQDALENFVLYLRGNGQFPPDRMRTYLDHKDRIEASVDQYLVDVRVLDERVDETTHLYSVKIRATINLPAFNKDTVMFSTVR